jgi:hypothetical protein
MCNKKYCDDCGNEFVLNPKMRLLLCCCGRVSNDKCPTLSYDCPFDDTTHNSYFADGDDLFKFSKRAVEDLELDENMVEHVYEGAKIVRGCSRAVAPYVVICKNNEVLKRRVWEMFGEGSDFVKDVSKALLEEDRAPMGAEESVKKTITGILSRLRTPDESLKRKIEDVVQSNSAYFADVKKFPKTIAEELDRYARGDKPVSKELRQAFQGMWDGR